MVVLDVLQLPSSADVSFHGDVFIFHPGHDRLLLSLPAFDSLLGQTGVNHRLVRDACYIIANNNDGVVFALVGIVDEL